MTLTTLFGSRSRVFWIIQTTAWIAYVVAAAIGVMAYDKPQSYIESYLDVILVSAAAGFVISTSMRYVYRTLWMKSPAVLVIGSFAYCYLMALIWRVLNNNVYWRWVKDGWQPEQLFDHVSGTMTSFYVLACWSGLYYGIKFHQQLQEQTEKTLKATAAAHQAQLKMLRYQLNPHFLFNTLNAISTLILDRSNEVANKTVTRLSDFLRYTLDTDPNNRVSLRKELEAIDLYLEIEKVRFSERLTIRREIEAEALDALVPSLILQPLIENAIKYAIAPRENGGTILISAKRQGDVLSMTVADDGPGLKPDPATGNGSCGVGLKNTRERLQQLYGDAQAFTLAPNQPQGLIVTINMPYQLS